MLSFRVPKSLLLSQSRCMIDETAEVRIVRLLLLAIWVLGASGAVQFVHDLGQESFLLDTVVLGAWVQVAVLVS